MNKEKINAIKAGLRAEALDKLESSFSIPDGMEALNRMIHKAESHLQTPMSKTLYMLFGHRDGTVTYNYDSVCRNILTDIGNAIDNIEDDLFDLFGAVTSTGIHRIKKPE